jgi:alkanesulfonate monooxygenase SsuD/methylene tetrahydromethanopterin reductase-like flavin-dependent oxidoreductase (luciferase family)
MEKPVTGNAPRFGVYLPPFGPFGDPAVLVDLAVRAEASGWDGVFLWDHLVRDAMPIADPWTTLGAIAQATRDLRFGPMVTPLARRRPWVVARHASTLSRLSGGRLILGTGLGSDESGDFSRFGEPTDVRTRSAMYDEGLEVIKAVWSGRAFHHRGQYYELDLDEGAADPYPIPVWVATSTGHPQVLQRAATCEGIFPDPGAHSRHRTTSLGCSRGCAAPGSPTAGHSTLPSAVTPAQPGRSRTQQISPGSRRRA